MLTREQCRQADRIAIEGFQIPSLVLMENAGRNCAAKILSEIRRTDPILEPTPDSRPTRTQRTESAPQAILLLCGPGNNGGDGFVMARHLYNAGLPVKVVLFGRPESYRGDAATNLNAILRLRIPIVEFNERWSDTKTRSVLNFVGRSPTTWVIDALLGTGAKGDPRPPMATAIEFANSMAVRRLAVDIPTGLDCDTGTASKTTFRAEFTCTFIAQKVGFPLASEEFLGSVSVVDIGAPPEIVRQSLGADPSE